MRISAPAWSKVLKVASTFGGYVVDSKRNASKGKDQNLSGAIALRVPSATFEDALAAVRTFGKVRIDSSGSQDVTQEFVDNESRLRNLRAQEAVLLKLMEKAKWVAESIQVQNSLSGVQGGIEQITGRQNLLRAQTDLSTITVALAKPGALPGTTSRFSRTLHLAKDGLIGMVLFGVVAVTWGIPLALLAGAVILITRKLRRRSTPAIPAT